MSTASRASSQSNFISVRTKGQSYFVSDFEELKSSIESGRVPFSAWIYREGVWRLLAEQEDLRVMHPEFEPKPEAAPENTKSQKDLSSLAPAESSSTVSAEPVWFFIRDRKKFGPYSAAEIVSKLQSKQLEATAFVWRPGFGTWQKLAQVPEFSRESMKKLAAMQTKKSDKTALDILVKRKFPRAPYEVEVIAHDNTRVLEGKTMVIGEGGLFLATPRPSHQVGSRLRLHFREGDTPSFNAVAEVVSVVRGGTAGYCMRFVALSDSDRRRIGKYVQEKK